MARGKQRHVLHQERWEEPGAEYARPSSSAGARAARTEPASAGGIATAAQPRAVAKGQDLGGQLPGRDADETPASGGRPVKRYIPYSLGSQDCVGQNLARHSMPASLAMLFSHFTFQLAAEACHNGLCIGLPRGSCPALPPCVCMEHCHSASCYAFTVRKCLTEHQRCQAQMGGAEGMSAAEDIGRLAYTRHPAHGLCTFWRPRLDLSGMKALHPGRGLLMRCIPRV